MRTAFGDSENIYGVDKWAITLSPSPQGLGQGNGSAPDIWEIISKPLLECLQDDVHGAVFKCCISQDDLKLLGYCFFEKSAIIQIAPPLMASTRETKNITQAGIYILSGASHATGG